MKRINILSVPKLQFAHVFGIHNQKNNMLPRENQIEITYISEGVLNYDGNGEKYTLKKGDVICNLFTDSIHFTSDVYHCHHTVGFSVDFELVDSNDVSLPELPCCLIGSENAKNIHALIDEIIRNHTIYPENELKCAGLFLELINLIGNEYKRSQNPSENREIKWVKKAKKYIFEHINEPIIQKDIAAHLGITPEYLCSVFKKSEGCSLINYVNKIKLDGIKTLMEKEKVTLHKAAAIYGFPDPSYVSRLYKKYYKVNITSAIEESERG